MCKWYLCSGRPIWAVTFHKNLSHSTSKGWWLVVFSTCTWRPFSCILATKEVFFIALSCSWFISNSVFCDCCTVQCTVPIASRFYCVSRGKKILQAPRNGISWHCLTVLLSFSNNKVNCLLDCPASWTAIVLLVCRNGPWLRGQGKGSAICTVVEVW